MSHIFRKLACLLLCCTSAFCTVSLGPHGIAGSTDGTSVATSPVDTSGFPFISVLLSSADLTGIITDATTSCLSPCNTWHLVASQGTAAKARLYYCMGCIVGAGHVFSYSGIGTFPSIAFAAFSGVATTGVLDQYDGGYQESGGLTIPGGTVTPTLTNELIIAVCNIFTTGTVSVDSSLSILDQTPLAAAQHYGSAFSYIIQTSIVTVSPIWTVSTSTGGDAITASFFESTSTSNTVHRVIGQ
jgi:hypothetical protein